MIQIFAQKSGKKHSCLLNIFFEKPDYLEKFWWYTYIISYRKLLRIFGLTIDYTIFEYFLFN